jgi:hypothetical protein
MIELMIASMVLMQEPASVSGDAHAAAVAREFQAIEDQMQGWEATIWDGETSSACRTIKSSGDPTLDDLACKAMAECATKMREVTARLNDPSATPADKQKIIGDANGGMTACVTSRRAELFNNLADERVRQRDESKNATN